MDLSMKSERRLLLRIGIAALAGTFGVLIGRSGAAGSMTPLEVAYAGSMGSMMDGAVRPAIAKALGADLRGRAAGSTGLANLIVAEQARKAGTAISFGAYFRVGLPLTLATLVFGSAWLAWM